MEIWLDVMWCMLLMEGYLLQAMFSFLVFSIWLLVLFWSGLMAFFELISPVTASPFFSPSNGLNLQGIAEHLDPEVIYLDIRSSAQYEWTVLFLQQISLQALTSADSHCPPGIIHPANRERSDMDLSSSNTTSEFLNQIIPLRMPLNPSGLLNIGVKFVSFDKDLTLVAFHRIRLPWTLNTVRLLDYARYLTKVPMYKKWNVPHLLNLVQIDPDEVTVEVHVKSKDRKMDAELEQEQFMQRLLFGLSEVLQLHNLLKQARYELTRVPSHWLYGESDISIKFKLPSVDMKTTTEALESGCLSFKEAEDLCPWKSLIDYLYVRKTPVFYYGKGQGVQPKMHLVVLWKQNETTNSYSMLKFSGRSSRNQQSEHPHQWGPLKAVLKVASYDKIFIPSTFLKFP